MSGKRTAVLVVSMVCFLIFAFSGCAAVSAIVGAEDYAETESGYTLKKYTGTSADSEFIMKDEHEGKPVTAIADFAIANTEYLKYLKIGKYVSEIGAWALTNSKVLERIEADPENEYFVTVDNVLYTKDMKTLVKYPNLRKDADGKYAYIMPESVEIVAENAFYLCGELKNITFSPNLKTVSDRGFFKCTKLETLALPEGLTYIGNDGFSFLHALEGVLTVPSTIRHLGDYAFYDVKNIDKVIVRRPRGGDLHEGRFWSPFKAGSIQNKIPVFFEEGK